MDGDWLNEKKRRILGAEIPNHQNDLVVMLVIPEQTSAGGFAMKVKTTDNKVIDCKLQAPLIQDVHGLIEVSFSLFCFIFFANFRRL